MADKLSQMELTEEERVRVAKYLERTRKTAQREERKKKEEAERKRMEEIDCEMQKEEEVEEMAKAVEIALHPEPAAEEFFPQEISDDDEDEENAKPETVENVPQISPVKPPAPAAVVPLQPLQPSKQDNDLGMDTEDTTPGGPRKATNPAPVYAGVKRRVTFNEDPSKRMSSYNFGSPVKATGGACGGGATPKRMGSYNTLHTTPVKRAATREDSTPKRFGSYNNNVTPAKRTSNAGREATPRRMSSYNNETSRAPTADGPSIVVGDFSFPSREDQRFNTDLIEAIRGIGRGMRDIARALDGLRPPQYPSMGSNPYRTGRR